MKLRLSIAAWPFLLVSVCASAGNSRQVTLADALKVESVGTLAFDPTGRHIVFERIPGFDSRASYGVSEERYNGELYVEDLDQDSPAKPLLNRAQFPFEGMWMAGFSPKGTRLAVLWLENGEAHMGAVDLRTRTLVKFPFTPDLGFFSLTVQDPVWLSEDELIMAALPPGRQPMQTGFREAAGRSLAR
jgi:hypothetical protein